MLHFFPCHYCASLPRRDGGVGRYSRSALPIPSPPGLPQHEGGFWCSTGLLLLLPLVGGRSGLPLWEICCVPGRFSAPRAPLTHDGANSWLALQRQGLMLASHTNNDTITACTRRVWRCTTTEKFSLQGDQPKGYYFPYLSLLRHSLQGSSPSHRSASTFVSAICLIGVPGVYLVQRILSKIFLTAKSARPTEGTAS